MNREELKKRLEMFRDNASFIMTRNEVQMHIDLLDELESDLLEMCKVVKTRCYSLTYEQAKKAEQYIKQFET